jgi:multidrug resistance efflux pump
MLKLSRNAANAASELDADPGPASGLGAVNEIERFREALHDPELQRASRAAELWKRMRGPIGKAVKIIAALVVVAVLGWQPIQRLVVFSSVEAVVNAPLITLRAPIDGHVGAPRAPTPGQRFAANEVLFKLSDPRADRSRLDDLNRQRDRVEAERLVASARLSAAQSEYVAAEAQLRSFLSGRRGQLDRRHDEIAAEVRAAEATHTAASTNLQRVRTLRQQSHTTEAIYERAMQEEVVANQNVIAARQRMAVLEFERVALAAGMYMGDNYNDLPRSAERLSELRQRIAEHEAELRARDVGLVRLEREIQAEKERFALALEADIASPGNTSVWEMLTSAGEQVRRGQDLARLLDCSNPLVTAAVGEAVFNRLHVGATARFRLKDTAEEWPGHVVQLSSLSSSPANYAIAPAFLSKEAYRVMIAVPGLSQSAQCPVGRTGRVVFDIGHPGLAALTLP